MKHRTGFYSFILTSMVCILGVVANAAPAVRMLGTNSGKTVTGAVDAATGATTGTTTTGGVSTTAVATRGGLHQMQQIMSCQLNPVQQCRRIIVARLVGLW